MGRGGNRGHKQQQWRSDYESSQAPGYGKYYKYWEGSWSVSPKSQAQPSLGARYDATPSTSRRSTAPWKEMFHPPPQETSVMVAVQKALTATRKADVRMRKLREEREHKQQAWQEFLDTKRKELAMQKKNFDADLLRIDKDMDATAESGSLAATRVQELVLKGAVALQQPVEAVSSTGEEWDALIAEATASEPGFFQTALMATRSMAAPRMDMPVRRETLHSGEATTPAFSTPDRATSAHPRTPLPSDILQRPAQKASRLRTDEMPGPADDHPPAEASPITPSVANAIQRMSVNEKHHPGQRDASKPRCMTSQEPPRPNIKDATKTTVPADTGGMPLSDKLEQKREALRTGGAMTPFGIPLRGPVNQDTGQKQDETATVDLEMEAPAKSPGFGGMECVKVVAKILIDAVFPLPGLYGGFFLGVFCIPCLYRARFAGGPYTTAAVAEHWPTPLSQPTFRPQTVDPAIAQSIAYPSVVHGNGDDDRLLGVSIYAPHYRTEIWAVHMPQDGSLDDLRASIQVLLTDAFRGAMNRAAPLIPQLHNSCAQFVAYPGILDADGSLGVAVVFDLSSVGGAVFASVVSRVLQETDLIPFVRPLIRADVEEYAFYIGSFASPIAAGEHVTLTHGTVITVVPAHGGPPHDFAVTDLLRRDGPWSQIQHMPRSLHTPCLCVLSGKYRFVIRQDLHTGRTIPEALAVVLDRAVDSFTTCSSFDFEDLDVQGEVCDRLIATASIPPQHLLPEGFARRDVWIFCDYRPLGHKPRCHLTHVFRAHIPSLLALDGVFIPPGFHLNVQGGVQVGDEVVIGSKTTLLFKVEAVNEDSASDQPPDPPSSGDDDDGEEERRRPPLGTEDGDFTHPSASDNVAGNSGRGPSRSRSPVGGREICSLANHGTVLDSPRIPTPPLQEVAIQFPVHSGLVLPQHLEAKQPDRPGDISHPVGSALEARLAHLDQLLQAPDLRDGPEFPVDTDELVHRRIRARGDQEAPVTDLLFFLYAPFRVPEVLLLPLRIPCTVQEALQAVAESRDETLSARYPEVIIADPQPDTAFASLLLAPAWALHNTIVLFDCRSINGALFCLDVWPRLNRESLCATAGLSSDPDVQVFVHGMPWALGAWQLVDLANGSTVTFLRRGQPAPQRNILEDMLFDSDSWNAQTVVPAPGGQHYLLLTEGIPHLFTLEAEGRLGYRDLIAQQLQFLEQNMTLQGTRPRLADVVHCGHHPYAAVVATEAICLLPVPPARLVPPKWILVLDLRDILLPLSWRFLACDTIPVQEILREFDPRRPDGFVVSVTGAPIEHWPSGPVFRIRTGQVLSVSFVADDLEDSSDPGHGQDAAIPSLDHASGSDSDAEMQEVSEDLHDRHNNAEGDHGAQRAHDEPHSPASSFGPVTVSVGFGILVPGFSIERIMLEIEIPTTIAAVTALLQQTRNAEVARDFPGLLPALIQPDPRWGLFLALPIWGSSHNTICIDMFASRQTVFAVPAPSVADRGLLLELAGLSSGADVEVYVDYEGPILAHSVTELQSGSTICLVSPGDQRPWTMQLSAMLSTHLPWDASEPYPSEPDIDRTVLAALDRSAMRADDRATFGLLDARPLSFALLSMLEQQLCTDDLCRHHVEVASTLRLSEYLPTFCVHDVTTVTMKSAIEVLETLGGFTASSVQHIKGHAGHPYNELVDTLAGATGIADSHVPEFLHPLCAWATQGTIAWLWLTVAALRQPAFWPRSQGNTLFDPYGNSTIDVSALSSANFFGEQLRDAPEEHKDDQVMWFQARFVSINVQSLGEDDSSSLPNRVPFVREQLSHVGCVVAALQETRAKCTSTVVSATHVRFLSARDQKGCFGVELWFARTVPYAWQGQQPLFFEAEDFRVLSWTPRQLFVRFAKGPLRIVFAACHAPTADHPERDSWWKQFVDQVVSFAGGDKVALLGDLNLRIVKSVPGRIGTRFGLDEDRVPEHFYRLLDCLDLWVPSTFDECHAGPDHTWIAPSGSAVSRIDYILIPASWDVPVAGSTVLHQVDFGQVGLDHFAVCLDTSVGFAGRLLPCKRYVTPLLRHILQVEHSLGGFLTADARWLRHFSSIERGGPVSPEDFVTRCIQRQRAVDLEMFEVEQTDLPTKYDLEHAMRQAKLGRACGNDGFPADVLHGHSGAMAALFYPVLLKTAYRLQEPIQFKGGTVKHIWKQKGAHEICSSHRGILISSTVGKAIHSASRSRCSPWLDRAASPLQVGGRRGFPVQLAAQAAREYQTGCFRVGLCSAIVFLDLREAFHRVARPLVHGGDLSDSHLAQVLHQLQLPPARMDDLRAYARRSSLLVDSGASAWAADIIKEFQADSWLTIGNGLAAVEDGTRPGDALADVVFSFLFSAVLRRIRETIQAAGVDVHLPWSEEWFRTPCEDGQQPTGQVAPVDVSWMDDLALLLTATSSEKIVESVRTAATILTDECIRALLRPNLDRGKTEALVSFVGKGSQKVRSAIFRSSDPSISLSSDLWPDARLRLVPKYRHLGGILHWRGSLDPEIRHRTAQAWAAFRKHRRLVFSSPAASHREKALLFHSLVLSTLLYGAGTWDTSHPQIVAKLHGTILCMVRQMLRRPTALPLPAISALPKPFLLLECLRLRLCCTLNGFDILPLCFGLRLQSSGLFSGMVASGAVLFEAL
ncbi:hypothetical protein AK812_SmicGene15638 [Symbiodinium microadriaticum]|uniref:RNase H type-1 domain-containing protein n=1 Tax=Symbiodinium microadriaticum TaxID=2951 RepID=A0A1Q9E2F7_SYMMI|nr:hypothetical protein AK812_SmicGene15638 [Symbiodinium microadriaticum]CAE6952212.1 unnamed protein product [Symbiodinium sp. KB8]CAE7307325.1 unnamed protein product [Symbiodinium microadriaticum]